MKYRKILTTLLLTLLSLSCSKEDQTVQSNGAGGSESDDSGVGGEGGTQGEKSCDAGSLGCACDEGVCEEGSLCQEEVCVECPPGDLGCACLSNDSCDWGGQCDDESGTCVSCLLGSEGCPCSDGACGTGLECTNEVCTVPDCPTGTLGCACDGDGECETGGICSGSLLCAECTNDISGCPCDEGECSGGLVCGVDDLCVAPITCDELYENDVCERNQLCTGGDDEDATCLEECEEGFIWALGFDGEIVTGSPPAGADYGCFVDPRCDDAGCVENQQCEIVGGLGSCLESCSTGYVWNSDTGLCDVSPCDAALHNVELQECATQYRSCYVDEDGDPQCGDCREFATENGEGECEAEFECPEDADGMCGGAEYCVSSVDGVDAGLGCQTHPCLTDGAPTPATAYDLNSDTCSACTNTVNCSGEGFTGRIWPVKDSDGDCVCETLDGYFLKPGETGGAAECDLDSDGWVTAESIAPGIVQQDAYWENNRCHLLKVERFQLVNEYHQRLDVVSCAGRGTGSDDELGVYFASTSEAGAVPANCTREPVYLVEPDQLDRSTGGDFPEVSAGREFLPEELNPLTKACLTVSGDFNYDGVADVAEEQALPVNPSDDSLVVDQVANAARLGAFSYFTEWHIGYYREPDAISEVDGAFVIAERSRCSESLLSSGGGALPIGGPAPHSFDGPTLHALDDEDYWRQCLRSRDVRYNDDTDDYALDSGLDFAKWTCEAEVSGKCASLPLPPTSEGPPTSEIGPDRSVVIDPHGLCDLAAAPAGAEWLGMNHHSQFECVTVVSSLPSPAEHYQVISSTLQSGAFNTCELGQCDDSDPDCIDEVSGYDGTLPTYDCTQGFGEDATPAVDTVGWMAKRFQEYATYEDGAWGGEENYEAGCVDERHLMADALCPDFSTGEAQDSGRLYCTTPSILLVDAGVTDTSPDGATWETAYPYLQDALDCVNSGGCPYVTEIWMTGGVYYPDESSYGSRTQGDITESFQVGSGVAIYGGLAGGETSRLDADPETNRTILSGDLGQNDSGSSLVTTDYTQVGSDNAYTVVAISPGDVLLYGLTITGGWSRGSPISHRSGGGIYGAPDSSLTLENVDVIGNYAESDGGAIYLDSPSTSLVATDCTFSGNGAGGGGGAVALQGTGGFDRVEFLDNRSLSNGGGLFYSTNALPWKIADSIFLRNEAGAQGGAIYRRATRGITDIYEDNLFAYNVAGTQGGGVYLWGLNLNVTNNTFYGNSATETVGASLYLSSIFQGNGFPAVNRTLRVHNSIIWGGSGTNHHVYGAAFNLEIHNSVMENGTAGARKFGAAFNTSTFYRHSAISAALPNFANVNAAQFWLNSADPNIVNQGNDAYNSSATDLAGNERRCSGTVIDIGAYEYCP